MANFEYAYHLASDRNTGPAILPLPVAASQTLAVGDLVCLSSGKVTKAGASTASVAGVMAQASDGATAGTLVRVAIIQPGQVWRATANADATSHVLAAKTYDINADTQTVDVADAAAGCLQILMLGESNTEVYVLFTAFDIGVLDNDTA